MKARRFRIAFLTGKDNVYTRRGIEAVSKLSGVDAVGVLLDNGPVSFGQRIQGLRSRLRSDGLMYPFSRLLGAVRSATDAAVKNAAVPRSEVLKVLRQAFPDECYSLSELGARRGLPVHTVGSLNGERARFALRALSADLGIVFETRILEPGTFSIPGLGCIHLHKGKLPEYGGAPAAFWELYDGISSAGLTVHFIDEGLNSGDIVATDAVPILKTDTPDSLRQKLNDQAVNLLVSAVADIRDGQSVRVPQPDVSYTWRSRPTRKEIASLEVRLPAWKRIRNIPTIARNLYVLSVYYSGLCSVCRLYHKLQTGSRAEVILYHRVNNYSKDALTVDTETFAAQLLAISKRYKICSTAELVGLVRDKRPLPPTTIAVHFDDCYRDIVTNGAPIMKAIGVPACAFINSGFLGTDRRFPFDDDKHPFTYPMLRECDLRSWIDSGFELGAHTVNHVDLGTCQNYSDEILDCGRALQSLAGKPIEFFSFPFGHPRNISAPARSLIARSGYQALFSAHGGVIQAGTDPYDIPRIGTSFEFPAVYWLLQIEGLALNQIRSAFARAGFLLKKPGIEVARESHFKTAAEQ